MDLSAGLASLDVALKIAKGLRAVEKAYDQVALKGQIIDLMEALYDAKGELLEASEALSVKDTEIQKLKDGLAQRKALIPGADGYFWFDGGDGVKRGFPICPACFLTGSNVQLVRAGSSVSTSCPSCSKKFSPVDFYLEPDAKGRQVTRQEKAVEDQKAQFERDTALLNGRSRDWMA